MDQIKRNLYELLFSCKGNWRNAIYVPCGPCPHPCKVDCSGCLATIRQDGAPLLVGVREFEEETEERIDPGDWHRNAQQGRLLIPLFQIPDLGNEQFRAVSDGIPHSFITLTLASKHQK